MEPKKVSYVVPPVFCPPPKFCQLSARCFFAGLRIRIYRSVLGLDPVLFWISRSIIAFKTLSSINRPKLWRNNNIQLYFFGPDAVFLGGRIRIRLISSRIRNPGFFGHWARRFGAVFARVGQIFGWFITRGSRHGSRIRSEMDPDPILKKKIWDLGLTCFVSHKKKKKLNISRLKLWKKIFN